MAADRRYLLTMILDLRPGDSGSWVVDAKTSKLYGYVVSVDAFGEAQVMPIHAILRSIKEQLKARRVFLPLCPEIDRLRATLKQPSSTAPSWSPGTKRKPIPGRVERLGSGTPDTRFASTNDLEEISYQSMVTFRGSSDIINNIDTRQTYTYGAASHDGIPLSSLKNC